MFIGSCAISLRDSLTPSARSPDEVFSLTSLEHRIIPLDHSSCCCVHPRVAGAGALIISQGQFVNCLRQTTLVTAPTGVFSDSFGGCFNKKQHKFQTLGMHL